MASNPSRLLLFFLSILGFLSISAPARPCKTRFYSVSFQPIYPYPNPNPRSVTIIVAEVFHQSSSSSKIFDDLPEDEARVSEPGRIQRQQQQGPFGFSSYNMSSFRDRTKDILSVFVALLFGVGCGALTAAAMCLVWFVFSSAAREDYGAEGDEDGDSTPKKFGNYVKISDANSIPEPVKQPV